MCVFVCVCTQENRATDTGEWTFAVQTKKMWENCCTCYINKKGEPTELVVCVDRVAWDGVKFTAWIVVSVRPFEWNSHLFAPLLPPLHWNTKQVNFKVRKIANFQNSVCAGCSAAPKLERKLNSWIQTVKVRLLHNVCLTLWAQQWGHWA